jgi:peptidoglycan/xylan/chitin deacetylase (PgdA/CDA1 family)
MTAAAAAAAWWSPALAPVAPGVARLLGLPRRIDRPDAIALTFDDGPHLEGTPAVLEMLRERDASAIFFVSGEQVEREPALAAEIVEAEQTIAVHCYRHRNMLRLPPRTFVDDLERAIASVEDATGVRPRLYRPPYGIFSLPGIVEVRARGLEPLLWSRWGHDWQASRSPEAIAAEATEDLSAGDVVLLHDADYYREPWCWRGTVIALPAILDRVQAAGLTTAN